MCVSIGVFVCPVGNSTQDIETHSDCDIIFAPLGGPAGCSKHVSMSVFNIDAEEVTESVPVFVFGVGTVS